MSIRLMTRVWDSGTYSGGTLLVLLALCDWANDQGVKIFPYLETLAEKARLSVKQTRRTLEILIEDGVVVSLDNAPMRKGAIINLKLNLEAAPFRDKMSSTAEAVTEVSEAGQTAPVAETSTPDSGTFAPAYIDNHQAIHQENPPREPPAPRSARSVGQAKMDLGFPPWLPQEPFQAFVAMRQKVRAPLTEEGKRLIINKLDKLRLAGHDPTAVLQESISNSWRGVFPLKEGGNGTGSKTIGRGSSHANHRAGWTAILDAESGDQEGPGRSGQLALGPPETG